MLGAYTARDVTAATSTLRSDAQRVPPRQLQLVVADDDRDTLLTLALILRDEGHTVHAAHRSAAVMPLVKSARPDAVILDIAMPGQSGYALAQEIQVAYAAARKPLLIAVTGEYKRPSDRLLSQLVGFDHYLLKPYAPGELIDLLVPLRPTPGPSAAT